MKVTELFHLINNKVPEAARCAMYETELKVTAEGIAEQPPVIIDKVKEAFLEIVKNLPNEKFDEFLQHLLALNYHKHITVGLTATSKPHLFEGHAHFHTLNKIEFIEDGRGWAEQAPNLDECEDEEEDDW